MFLQKYFFEILYRCVYVSLLNFIICGILFYYKFLLLYWVTKLIIITKTFNIYYIYTKISDLFVFEIKLICLILVVLNSVIIYNQILTFYKPGLYIYEYKRTKKIYIKILFFLFSFFFFNIYYFFPFFYNCFMFFNQGSLINFNIYYESQLNTYLNMFLTFNYLVYLNSLSLIGLIFLNQQLNFSILQTRKIFLIIITFFSTFITPPTIESQLFVFLILSSSIEFYFLTIFYTKFFLQKIFTN